jgi:hypothetical protein
MGVKKLQMKNVILVIVFLLLGYYAEAQTLQQRYLHAKDLYRAGDYGLARGVFQMLAKETVNNPFLEYSSFFYALSAYHEGYDAYARDILLQMKFRHADWENLDEVNYWLAKIDFENKNYDQALENANLIRNKSILQDTRNMKIHYLGKIGSEDSLLTLLNIHSTDTVLARLTADKIHSQPIVNRDTDLLDELIGKYKLNRSKFEIAVPESSMKKKEYRVAVLLPFMFKEFSNSALNRKNFVYELYEGINLAVKDLQDRGVNIKLYAYDTRRDSTYTRQLLAMDELKGMDLIIGPISSEEIDVASSFSYHHRINMVNPVSTNSQIVGRNPYSFLFLPSLETQAKQAANFAAENFYGKQNSLIIYGESQRDSILAYNYQNTIKEKGFQVIGMRKVRRQDERELFRILTNTMEIPTEGGSIRDFTFPRDSIGHIYVASDGDDEMIAMYLISALETRSDNIKILGHEEWLDYTSIIPEQLERLQVHLVAPTYFNYTSEKFRQFRERYLSRTYTLPTKFASLGYDMMMLYGTLLQQYGVHFQVKFEEVGFKEGIILPGYQYDKAQDNQYVPIIRFIDSELVNVNHPK